MEMEIETDINSMWSNAINDEKHSRQWKQAFDEAFSKALQLQGQYKALKVVDEGTYLIAGDALKSIKEYKNKILEYFKPIKEAAWAAHKGIMAKEKDALLPADQIELSLRREINSYFAKIDAERRAEQKRLEAEAAAKAEAERQKLLERAVKAKSEEKAAELLEKAEEVYAAPVRAPVVVAKTERTGYSTITQKTDIKVTVLDLKLLLKEIINFNIPESAIEIKLNTLKTYCKAMGLKGKDVPGLLIEEIFTASVR